MSSVLSRLRLSPRVGVMSIALIVLFVVIRDGLFVNAIPQANRAIMFGVGLIMLLYANSKYCPKN